MKVLSLFDGMSCGRVALERAGLPVTTYFASELDKYAIAIAQKNYPSTVQLGDVRVVREMAEAGFFGHMDLLIGGSPCQGFSFSGKQLAFDDPRSVLFFEFVRILRALQKDNPNIKFLLENVKMKKEHLNVITSFLGVNPVFINSALVSAQNRQRYYWANWPISQPADRGILLKDIIENSITGAAFRGRPHSKFEIRKDKKSNAILSDGHQSRLIHVGSSNGTNQQHSRIYCVEGKSPTLMTRDLGGGHSVKITYDRNNYRKLTPVECERLQTLPDNYTAGVSDTQRYRMLGNGWTVEVVAHIFRGLRA